MSNRLVIDCRDSKEILLSSVKLMISVGETIGCESIKSYANEDFGDALSKVMPKVIFLGNEEQSNEHLEKVLNTCDAGCKQKWLKYFRKRQHCSIE